jgi:hypothetical protein
MDKDGHNAARTDCPSLVGTFEAMVISGELDASDAEERFAEILNRARAGR